MKKVRIPFSLDEYNKGGYEVETRGHKKVRIICTDRIDNVKPIIALIKDGMKEIYVSYRDNGKYRIENADDHFDLCLIREEFEDGDIIADGKGNIAIFKKYTKENRFFFYAQLGCSGTLCFDNDDVIDDCRLAAEAEKQKLFNALAKGDNKWNTETKQVEDIVRDIKPECGLQPFDKVLVRDKGTEWGIELFSRYNDSWDCCYHFECLVNNYQECIPYNEETRHLFGTKKDAPEKYKIW